jgi:cell division protein FtsN
LQTSLTPELAASPLRNREAAHNRHRNDAMDADSLRAQLALQGVNAKVQRVAVDADVWHRVRIGPISNLDELNKVRRQLRAAEVDALVIRVGD